MKETAQGRPGEPALARDDIAARRDGHIAQAGSAVRRIDPQFFTEIIVDPSRGSEADLHAVLVAVPDAVAQDLSDLGKLELQVHGSLLRRVARGDQTGAGHKEHALFVEEFQCLHVVTVQSAKGCIDAEVQPRLQRVFDPGDRVPVARRADKAVMHFFLFRIEGDLDAVQGGLPELLAVFFRQTDAIRVQPCHEPRSMRDQFRQILAHGRLSSGEGHLRDPDLPAVVDDLFPVLRAQFVFGGLLLSRRIAVDAVLVAVPGTVHSHRADTQVHPVRRLHVRRISPDVNVFDAFVHRLTVCDLCEGPQDPGDVLLQASFQRERIDFFDRCTCAPDDPVGIRLADLAAVVLVDLLDQCGQEDAPGDVDRDKVHSVDDRDACKEFPVRRPGRDKVDPDDPRALRIERGMPDLMKILIGKCQFSFRRFHGVSFPNEKSNAALFQEG